MNTYLHFRFRLWLLGMFFVSWTVAQAQTATEAWVRRYNDPEAGSQDYARKVVIDPDGNVVVAGDTDDGITPGDILIIKYSGVGIPLWTNRYNGPTDSDDTISDLAVDNWGNVFVAGSSKGVAAFLTTQPWPIRERGSRSGPIGITQRRPLPWRWTTMATSS